MTPEASDATAMEPALTQFLGAFRASFIPPAPNRGERGTSWLISDRWSRYVKHWLKHHYRVQFEFPAGNRRRLDAALWPKQPPQADGVPMHIALEWEWDNNKVERDFPEGDLEKVLTLPAKCGVAIIQTRTDGRRGSAQAERAMERIYRGCRRHSRPIGIIEIRRVLHSPRRVEFACVIHDPTQGTSEVARAWSFR